MSAIQMESPHLPELIQVFNDTEVLDEQRQEDADDVLALNTPKQKLNDILNECLRIFNEQDSVEDLEELELIVYLIVKELVSVVPNAKSVSIDYLVGNSLTIELEKDEE